MEDRSYVLWLAHSLLRNDADAEDASQRIFLKLITGPPRETGPIKNLIRVMARNTAIDMLREKSRRHEEPIESAEQQEQKDLIANWYREEQQTIAREMYRELMANVGLTVEPAEYVFRHDPQLAYAYLRRAFAGLRPDERLLWLYYLEGKSIPEIAKELHITLATAHNRLSRAMARLRDRLKAALPDPKRSPSD